MCGIVGILNTKNPELIDENLLAKMISIIRHRGPDETGIYTDSSIGLGHARLSIIGLAGGTQPICNEDGSLWIVYNGEAFNYIELKEDLLTKGHTFSTTTDTEVLLHLYEELGPQCLEKINGQFAIAIWDASKKELFLARDRVGIRPLYFTQINGKFLFASEIKAIFLDPNVKREIDPKALYQVFTFWTTLTPKTIFKNVYTLPPGHYMIVKDGQSIQKPYWNIPFHAPEECWNGSFEEAKEELRTLLKDAVRLRLRADVPVGAYASGGLDSSITTALISRYFNNQLRTFSMSFQEVPFDETSFQQNLVQFLGTQHSQAPISNVQIRDYFPEAVWHCEIPLLRTAPVPLLLLSKLVRENQFKVVLTGEGSDEILGGYNIFKEAKVRHFWGKRPESKLRPLLLEKLYPYVFKDPSRARFFLQKFYAVNPEDLEDPLFSHRIRWKNSGKNTTFFSDQIRASLTEYQPLDEVVGHLSSSFYSRDSLSKAQVLEMGIFLSNYLLSSQGDRVAMANSLEIRLPFLDYRVIDFAFRLPAKWKIKGLNEKYILKRSSAGLIPEEIRTRAKQPYRAPIREAFFGDKSGSYVKELLSQDYVKHVGYFHEKKINRLLAKYQKSNVSSEIQDMAFLGILSTQLVYQQFIENFTFDIKPVRPDKIIRN
jgi:asparagine synthase (glutamine-hydrolysing)